MDYETGKRLDSIMEKLEKIEMTLDSFLEVYTEQEEEEEEGKEPNIEYDQMKETKQIMRNR